MRVMKESRLARGEEGYLMVALLVALSVMAVMMSMALPAWSTLARREKEAELIFRGEQYARAIALYQRRFANASPPSIDELVNGRFLRKKYKDPITDDEFQVVMAGAALPGETGPTTGAGGRTVGAITPATPAGRTGGNAPSQMQQMREVVQQTQDALAQLNARMQLTSAGSGRGGIVGVVSKSTERSFRLYNGRDTYNQWVFMGVQQSARAGGPPGANTPGPPGAGGRGGRGAAPAPVPPAGRGAPPPQPPPPPARGGFGNRNFQN